MNRCTNCGMDYSDEVLFCPQCGAKLVAVEAQNPVAEQPAPAVQEAETTAPTVQEQSAATPAQEYTEQPVDSASVKDSIFSRIPKMAYAITAAVVVIVLLAVVIISGLGKKGNKNVALYIKDTEIQYSNLSQKKPFEVTSKLVEDGSVDKSDLYDWGDDIAEYIKLSSDGKTIFFPDKINENDDGFNLYYRELNNEKKEAVKIDSCVEEYVVSENGKLITYYKNGSLYQSNLKDKEKIASDSSYQFFVSPDGKSVVWRSIEGKLSLWKNGEDEKLDSDISSIVKVSKDLSEVYYLKDGILYGKKGKAAKEKVSSDVYSVLRAYDDGIYFLKSNEESMTYLDFVEDDMLAVDERTLAAEAPAYPDWWSDDYDAQLEKYNAYYDEYYAASSRNDIREYLKDYYYSEMYLLYYYDGNESKLVSESFQYKNYEYAWNVPALIFESKNDFKKVSMSDLYKKYAEDYYSYWGLTEYITEKAEINGNWYLVSKDKANEVNLEEDVYEASISPNADKLLYMTNQEGSKGELYTASIKNNSVENKQLLTDEAYEYCWYFINEEGMVCYFEDVDTEDYLGTLFCDGQKIDDDVYIYSADYQNDKWSYYIDYNYSKEKGTLKIATGKKKTVIAEDVHANYVLENGEILYLSDFSLNHYTGDLYLYNGKKSVKVDDDVIAIIPVY